MIPRNDVNSVPTGRRPSGSTKAARPADAGQGAARSVPGDPRAVPIRHAHTSLQGTLRRVARDPSGRRDGEWRLDVTVTGATVICRFPDSTPDQTSTGPEVVPGRVIVAGRAEFDDDGTPLSIVVDRWEALPGHEAARYLLSAPPVPVEFVPFFPDSEDENGSDARR